MKCFIALFALIAAASAAPQYAAPAVIAPAYGPAPIPVYPDTPPAYDYSYGVADAVSGANFGASEARNGYSTSGEYHVALPDGRLQTVTYTTDGDSGFIADVKYSGEPVYAAAPAYAPAPIRVAAPVAVAAPLRPIAPIAPLRPAFFG